MNQSALLTIFASSASAASANLYETLFASLGATGVVTDGLLSDWLQSSGGSPAGNGDVLGYMPDISGSGNHLEQTTGANKPTVTVTNGIPAATAGNNKEIGASITFTGTSEFSWVGVCYGPNNTTPLEWFIFQGGSLDFLQFHDPNDWLTFAYDGIDKGHFALSALRGGPMILRVVYKASAVFIYAYDMAGSLVASTGTGLFPATANFDGPYTLFFSVLAPQGSGEIAFSLVADKAITGDNWTAVLADLVSRYGGWHA